MLGFRMTTLCDAVTLSAKRRNEADLDRLKAIIDEQAVLNDLDNEAFARLDFIYHKEIYVVSGNVVYPMVHNSIYGMHHALALNFYKALTDKSKVKEYHREIYQAIKDQEPEKARELMVAVLELGNEVLGNLSYFLE
jgi:DNA-binding FadR family transcriptional regulator